MDQLEQLLTIQALAQLLGVPQKTIYQWNYRGTGPRGFMVGRSLRWRPGDVAAWINERAAAAQRQAS